MEDNLVGLLRALALQRQHLEEVRQEKAALIEALKARQDYQTAVMLEGQYVDAIAELESKVHKLGHARYLATGSKKPAPGLGIRVSRKMVCDARAAADWCREKLPTALTVDMKVFEKYAAAVADIDPVPCVEWQEVITVTVASDLVKALDAAMEGGSDA